MKHLLLLFFILLSTDLLFAQSNQEGFYTSEAATVASENEIFVSIKKYNPTEEEITHAAKPKKNAPMNYLQVPFLVTNASLYNNGFESMLYCFEKSGNIKWSKSIGLAKNSVASPVVIDNGFLYTGCGTQEGDKIQLQKLDKNGKQLWSKTFDSLEYVNSIAIGGKMVNALVSFETSKKVQHSDKTFSYNTYPIYFFLQLDTETGAVIKKEYQMMGNYLSSIGFSNPYVSSYASYYLNNKDSAIFLSIENQKSANVVSEEMPKENKILNLTAGPSENHFLTIENENTKNAAYVLFSDFYGAKQKYNSKLSVKPSQAMSERTYLLQNENDSMLCVVAAGRNVSICWTDKSGKTDCSTKENITSNTVVAAGLQNGKPYFVSIKGRTKPGEPGKVEIFYY